MSAPTSIELPPTRITDPTFLDGLRVVLQGYYERNASEEEIQAVVKRAETFFLSSRADLDLEQPAPLNALTSVPPAASAPPTEQQPPSTSSSSSDEPPYPPTFSQLAHLISTGAPIPGIRDIPDQLAEGEPSEPKLARTQGGKPWEKVLEGQTAGVVGLEGRGEGERGQERVEEEGSGQV
ncbi:hypothetical protein JCM11251_005708 [Rhodosporidiobolus azoricus]